MKLLIRNYLQQKKEAPSKLGFGVGNGGIRLGINYSVSNEMKRDK